MHKHASASLHPSELSDPGILRQMPPSSLGDACLQWEVSILVPAYPARKPGCVSPTRDPLVYSGSPAQELF